MIVNLSRHVFGSHQGYRTLAASEDLTADELAELQSFVFGQTNNAEYLATLKSTPAYWSRQLSSGRRAVTRVFVGPKDDQGRQSLRFVSAILYAKDWISAINGEDGALVGVDKIWSWDGKPRLPRIEVRVTKPDLVNPNAEQRQRILSLVGLIESMSNSPNSSIVVEERQLAPAEFAMVLALLPVWFRPQFSYGFRSLSEALPVQLNYLAPCASRGKSRRKVTPWRPHGGYASAKYASGLAHFWPEGGPPPWEFVENCKAFGDLLPTFEGTEVSSGTVAPPAPTLKQKRRQQRRQPRVPRIVYWLTAMALIIGATTYVAVNTIMSRRHADAVLDAADAFLTENADSSQLPAAGHKRKKIIETAQSHADEVADLTDSSRADRRDAVATKLNDWLSAAGDKDTKLVSLDEMLTSFETFAKPLGLENPESLVEIPDATSRSAVVGWKKRLEDSQAEASLMGEPYPTKIASALNRIHDWNVRIKELLNQCDAGLDGILKILGGPLPTTLTNAIDRTWSDVQSQLAKIDKILPEAQVGDVSPADPTTIDEYLSELMEQRDSVQHRVDSWAKHINKIKSEMNEFLDEAKGLVAEHKLKFDPVDAEAIQKPWTGAASAKGALEQALDYWPDSEEMLLLEETVESWMNKAADLAMAHFNKAIDQADSIWYDEKKRSSVDAQSNGLSTLPPNPTEAIKSLNVALDYWDANSSAIRHFDARMADRRHRQAVSLKTELINANSNYDKVVNPTPSPTPKP